MGCDCKGDDMSTVISVSDKVPYELRKEMMREAHRMGGRTLVVDEKAGQVYAKYDPGNPQSKRDCMDELHTLQRRMMRLEDVAGPSGPIVEGYSQERGYSASYGKTSSPYHGGIIKSDAVNFNGNIVAGTFTEIDFSGNDLARSRGTFWCRIWASVYGPDQAAVLAGADAAETSLYQNGIQNVDVVGVPLSQLIPTVVGDTRAIELGNWYVAPAGNPQVMIRWQDEVIIPTGASVRFLVDCGQDCR